MLDNQELALDDRFCRMALWYLAIVISIVAIGISFALLRWGPAFQYYLIALLLYAVLAVFVGYKVYPRLKGNIRVMRGHIRMLTTIFLSMIWPFALYIWRRLEGRVSEYERIQFTHLGIGD